MFEQLETPVAFLIFNRPEKTRRVFEQIKKVKPKKLLVVCDGARNPEEEILVAETRKIIEEIDWPCQVLTNYADKNMGCRIRISSGIDWVFSNVERAIILEADCLPHPTFFPFCEELLKRYADDSRIMHISGNFFQQKNKNFRCPESYYFSILPHIWGWASWRRAWKQYDLDIKQWPEARAKGVLRNVLTDPAVYERWEIVWNGYYNKIIDSWDGPWTFACMLNNGLSINPAVNLVSNIGFGLDAIHTKDLKSIFANIPTEAMKFPLIHPKLIVPDAKADAFNWRQNFGINASFRQRILGPIRRKFPKAYGFVKNLYYSKLCGMKK